MLEKETPLQMEILLPLQREIYALLLGSKGEADSFSYVYFLIVLSSKSSWDQSGMLWSSISWSPSSAKEVPVSNRAVSRTYEIEIDI